MLITRKKFLNLQHDKRHLNTVFILIVSDLYQFDFFFFRIKDDNNIDSSLKLFVKKLYISF